MSDKNIEKSEALKGDEDLLLDHDYDGIKELDYPLPNWWRNLFYITIVFSVVYAGYYMLGFGPTLNEELASGMKRIEKMQAVAPKVDNADEEVYAAALKDPGKLKLGQVAYAAKCGACHGDRGQGLIGPNLTDDFWLHGKGKLKDIAKVVSDGVPDKGMPPWAAVLLREELIHVVAFIKSIRGTAPAGAKEPQGELQSY